MDVVHPHHGFLNPQNSNSESGLLQPNIMFGEFPFFVMGSSFGSFNSNIHNNNNHDHND